MENISINLIFFSVDRIIFKLVIINFTCKLYIIRQHSCLNIKVLYFSIFCCAYSFWFLYFLSNFILCQIILILFNLFNNLLSCLYFSFLNILSMYILCLIISNMFNLSYNPIRNVSFLILTFLSMFIIFIKISIFRNLLPCLCFSILNYQYISTLCFFNKFLFFQ